MENLILLLRTKAVFYVVFTICLMVVVTYLVRIYRDVFVRDVQAEHKKVALSIIRKGTAWFN